MRTDTEYINRQPAVAGKFYPGTPGSLQQELERLFKEARPRQCENTRAIICPHAGYVFSGGVAASAFNQIDVRKKYKRIFIIGSSHHVRLQGAAVYTSGDFLTPLGIVTVDTAFCEQLAASHPGLFVSDLAAHRDEHSLEVELPLLHYVMQSEYRIVPIIIGTSHPETCREIAQALKPFFTRENLFIISSDFSHYPSYRDARNTDEITKNAILENNPVTLMDALINNSRQRTQGLVTSLCGWTSVLTLLYMTTGNNKLTYKAIEYRNSGDGDYCFDKDSVVGYWGIAVCEQTETEMLLSDEDKATLLKIAREAVESALTKEGRSRLCPGADTAGLEYPASLRQKYGAFVTLHHKGNLRGCIGHMTGDMPLFRMIREMALAAAFSDYRFNPVEKEDLPYLTFEISVLSPLVKISDASEIEPGKHGILIEDSGRSGVFLPQVATETGWSKEEFLGHCSRDKAGLGWDGWKKANLYVFTAIVFS